MHHYLYAIFAFIRRYSSHTLVSRNCDGLLSLGLTSCFACSSLLDRSSNQPTITLRNIIDPKIIQGAIVVTYSKSYLIVGSRCRRYSTPHVNRHVCFQLRIINEAFRTSVVLPAKKYLLKHPKITTELGDSHHERFIPQPAVTVRLPSFLPYCAKLPRRHKGSDLARHVFRDQGLPIFDVEGIMMSEVYFPMTQYVDFAFDPFFLLNEVSTIILFEGQYVIGSSPKRHFCEVTKLSMYSGSTFGNQF